MRNGFSFKGRHSDEYGAVVKTRSRPVRPEMKSSVTEALASDGAYDFSCANPYGRDFYNDRIFEMELRVSADDLRSLDKKVSGIARWLMGRGDIVFDDMPYVKWEAAALSEIGFMPELTGHKAVLTAVFRVKPFSECMFDTMNGIVIGTDCMLQCPVPLEVKAYFTYECAKNSTAVFNVDNIGSWYVRPVVRVVSDTAIGSGTITINANTISFSGISAKELVIDNENQTVTDGNGNNLIGQTSGEFFELFGDRASVMSVRTISDVSVTVEYIPKCVYDFDFMSWGDYNA